MVTLGALVTKMAPPLLAEFPVKAEPVIARVL
jgi:hypothetical protein